MVSMLVLRLEARSSKLDDIRYIDSIHSFDTSFDTSKRKSLEHRAPYFLACPCVCPETGGAGTGAKARTGAG
jgi:hypothetical protein